MAPGFRRLRTPSPRHRALFPPPALTGGRPVRVVPFCRAASSALSAQPVRRRLAASGLRWPFFELPGLVRRQPLRRGRVLKSLVKKTTSSQLEAFGAQARFYGTKPSQRVSGWMNGTLRTAYHTEARIRQLPSQTRRVVSVGVGSACRSHRVSGTGGCEALRLRPSRRAPP